MGELLTIDTGLQMPRSEAQINPFAENASVAERAEVLVEALHRLKLVPDMGNTVTDVYTEHVQNFYEAAAADAKAGDKPLETLWAMDLDETQLTFGALRALYTEAGLPSTTFANLWDLPHLSSAQLNKRTMTQEPQPNPTVPLRGRVMAVLPGDDPDGLHAVKKDWKGQQSYLRQFIDRYSNGRQGRTDAYAAAPQDIAFASLQRQIGSPPQSLLDPNWSTATRYVQHEMVEVELDGGRRAFCGPNSSSSESRVDFDGSGGASRPDGGVRVLVGPEA